MLARYSTFENSMMMSTASVRTTTARGSVSPGRRVDDLRLRPMGRIPAADRGQQHDRGQREQGEGQDRPLPERHDDEGGEQRAGRLAEIAADLKQALGEAMPAARRRPGDARGLGMKDGAADADQRHRDKQQRIGVGEGEADEANQRERHASRQQRVHRPAVGDEAENGCNSEAVD